VRIDGKVVLITGASQGIGAACAAEFGRNGAKLSLTARSEEGLRRAGGPDALVTTADLTDEASRRRVVEATLERFGAIDILINNAGVGGYIPSWRTPMEDARRMLELNFFALLGMIQLVTPHMRTRRSGTIVNVGSIAGKMTLPWMTLYSASKYAVASLTEGLRSELKRDGVHAMLVCPGYVQTRFQENVIGDAGPPPDIKRSRRFAITSQECARDIRRGVERNARTVVTPSSGWLLLGLYRLFTRPAEARMAKMIETA
jgi:short-subunit dehydrogenase